MEGYSTDRAALGGPMPVELVRARLFAQVLPRDYKAGWKYAGELAAATR